MTRRQSKNCTYTKHTQRNQTKVEDPIFAYAYETFGTTTETIRYHIAQILGVLK